ncbi:MAG: hypothetical protein RR603_00280 [Kurthia sp.]
MDIIKFAIMPIIVGLIVTFIFTKIYKNKEKVDHGFALNYFGLSYRRKMIRTLYTFPILMVVLVLLLITVIGFIIQFVYNYIRWKQEHPPV